MTSESLRLRLGFSAVSLICTVLFPVHADALPSNELNERIHASACEPELPTDRSKVVLASSGWTFLAGQTGTVNLVCPVFTPYYDQANGFRKIVELRLWYHDADGMGEQVEISATLLYRRYFSSSSFGFIFNTVSSNSSATTTPTTAAVPFAHDMLDAQYSVSVRLERLDATLSAVFRGISFRE